MSTVTTAPSTYSPAKPERSSLYLPSSDVDARKFSHSAPSWPPPSASYGSRLPQEVVPVMDPDEYFVKHSVTEVRTILYRLRSDVDAKQEELRLMVGERYRDILQASTSIISMEQSSRRVVETLERVKTTVASQDVAATSTAGLRAEREDDTQLHALQSLAAHIKLLLDAPEHLWRFLEQRMYLQATWLFLLTRVVHRSLLREDADDIQQWERYGINVQQQFPIVQRQWESVSHFRSQISHKATLSLRELSMSSQNVCGALLSLHLLESMPMADALETYLKQRLRTLQTLCGNVEPGASSSAGTSTSERSNKKLIREILAALEAVLGAISRTVSTARDVFAEGNANVQPLMANALAYLEGNDQTAHPFGLPEDLKVTTQSLLASLPSSNHFLVLPEVVKSYRPFVDSQSSSTRVTTSLLSTKVHHWLSTAAAHLGSATKVSLLRLDTISSVWRLRSSLTQSLSKNSQLLPEELRQVRDVLDEHSLRRVEEIWTTTLSITSERFKAGINSMFDGSISNKEVDDVPARFLVDAPQLPAVSHSVLSATLTVASFNQFNGAINQRLYGRTPRLEKILSELELAVAGLKEDSELALADEDHSSILLQQYAPSAEVFLTGLLDHVEKVLHEARGETDASVSQTIFLGRLLLQLSTSSIMYNLRSQTAVIEVFSRRRRDLFRRTIEQWASIVVPQAVKKFLAQLSRDHVQNLNFETTQPSCPSPALIDALYFMSDCVQLWGIFHDLKASTFIAELSIRQFVEEIGSAGGKLLRASKQLIWDLSFLEAICSDWGRELTPSSLEIRKLSKGVEMGIDGGAYLQSATQYLQQTRLILAPLLPPPTTTTIGFSTKKPSSAAPKSPTSSSPAHTPTIGMDNALPPIMDLIKTSPRFGSLWIGQKAR